MKISQEAREAAEQLEDMEWPGNHALYTHMIEQHLQSLINSTLERAAGVADEFKQMGYMSDRERDYCQQHGEEIATVIRQLMESE